MTILKKSPSQKSENVFQMILKQSAITWQNMSTVDIRTGRPAESPETADVIAPTLDVWMQGAKVVPDLEDEWEGELHTTFTCNSDDENAKILDDRVQFIICTLGLPENILPLVNFPLASRPEPDYWLVDVFQIHEESSTHERYYREEITWMVKFRNDNGQG